MRTILTFLLIILLTIIIVVIYILLYNKHINSSNNKRWASPLKVCVITLLSLLVISIITSIFRFVNESHNEITYGDTEAIIYNEQDIKNSEYTNFNGQNIDGYEVTNENSNNFNYSLYKKIDKQSESMPNYIIILTYTGNKNYKSAFSGLSISTKTGSSKEGEVVEKSEKYYIIIFDDVTIKDDNNNILDVNYNIVYQFKLYDEYIDINLKNIEDYKPIEKINIKLK